MDAKELQYSCSRPAEGNSNAEWGCSDDVHKAWMIVDVEDKEQALQTVPPSFRADARVTRLFKVTREDVEQYKEGSSEKDPVKYHK